ncbi:MAG: hypothetical protein HOW73_47860 [Polyangiaceae bacterium]|nr:hypothetical protein [Polyangiaceae bacterium]
MSACTCIPCGLHSTRPEDCDRLARHPMHWRDLLVELAQEWHATHAADLDQLDAEDCLRSFRLIRSRVATSVDYDANGAVKVTLPRRGFVNLDLEDVSNVFADLESSRRKEAKVRKIVRYSGKFGDEARVCCPCCDATVEADGEAECQTCFRRFVSLEDRLRKAIAKAPTKSAQKVA